MGLEEDIKKLKEAEMGEVEKTITAIENSAYERKEIASEQEDLVVQYSALVKQKVSTAIDNIFLLKEYISKPEFDKYAIIPQKPNGYLELSLKFEPYRSDYLLRILFKEEDRTEEISLYQGFYSRFSSAISLGKKWFKYYPLITSKSSLEFSEKFARGIIKELTEGSDLLPSLMYKIINTPEEVRDSYLGETERKKKKKDNLSSEIEKINSIKVASF